MHVFHAQSEPYSLGMGYAGSRQAVQLIACSQVAVSDLCGTQVAFSLPLACRLVCREHSKSSKLKDARGTPSVWCWTLMQLWYVVQVVIYVRSGVTTQELQRKAADTFHIRLQQPIQVSFPLILHCTQHVSHADVFNNLLYSANN